MTKVSCMTSVKLASRAKVIGESMTSHQQVGSHPPIQAIPQSTHPHAAPHHPLPLADPHHHCHQDQGKIQ